MGTRGYTAPELLVYDFGDERAGQPSVETDVYALGMVMWEVRKSSDLIRVLVRRPDGGNRCLHCARHSLVPQLEVSRWICKL